jgi:hypothetical protein
MKHEIRHIRRRTSINSGPERRIGPSRDPNVAGSRAHEPATTSSAEHSRAFETHNALSAVLAVPFLMVKATACHIIQPTITWNIHTDKGCHQLPSKSIVPQLPAVYMEANIFSIVPVQDEGIQDRGIENEGQKPVPPFMTL